MHKVSTTVVLACYNGAKKIRRQLESLRLQTSQPDEVLIFDDCSTDNTLAVVQDYICQYDLFGWKTVQNERNLGWKQNFFSGLLRAKGDIIFPCDQDDKWSQDKIEKMLSIMEEREEIALLACDYDIAYGDQSIKMKKYKKKNPEKATKVARYQFNSRFFQNPSPGCTYAIRKTFIDQVNGYWFLEAPHDEFLWLMAALGDQAWFLNEPLLTIYREEGNASDIRYKDISIQKENLKYISTMLSKLEQHAGDHLDNIPEERKDYIEKAKRWCEKRKQIMDTRNPFRWLIIMPYWHYYNSWRNCLSDLYLILFGSFSRQK